MTVEAKIKNKKVRFINGYGVQENSSEEQKRNFFDKLDLEVKKAKTAGAFICMEMDLNAKLGKQYISGDPKQISDNGMILESVIVENNLVIVNGTPKCEGVITRYRKTINGVEAAVLDHLLVCNEFFKLISKMTIDEGGKYALTKYTHKCGDRTCRKESDHRTIIVEIDVNWSTIDKPKVRLEVFNYKDKESFDMFVKKTTDNKELEKCFDNSDENLEVASKRWFKMLNCVITLSFRKIRLKKSSSSPILE